MKRLIYLLLAGSLLSLMLVSGFSLSLNVRPALAQGCTVIDTIVITAHATTYTGTANTIPGRLYDYRISGTADNGFLTVRDALYGTTDPSPWNTYFQNYTFSGGSAFLTPGTISFNGSWPAYSATHEYTIQAWGNGNPVSARVDNDAAPVTNFTIEVCEYPQPYTTPSCTAIAQIDMNSAISSWYTGPTLANGNTYNLYFVGQSDYGGWPTASSLTIDPYWSSSDNWVTQSSFPSIFFNTGTYTSTTLIDTTFQTDHVYQVDVIGNGSAIQFNTWSGARGGVRAIVCDPLITPTPGPTGTPSPTPTSSAPPFARSCILLGSANSNFTAGNTWTWYGSGVDTPEDASSGVQLPVGGAFGALPLRLQQTSQYKVEVQFRFQVIPEDMPSQRVTVGLGERQDHSYSIDPSLFTQYAAFGPFNYVPDTDGFYSLTITRPAIPSGIDDPKFVVDWICVTQTSSAPEPGAGGNPTDGGAIPGDSSGGGGSGSGQQCQTCPEYAPHGGLDHIVEDVGQFVGVLWCRIAGLIGCVILALLQGAWFTLRNILGFMGNSLVWVGKTGRGFFEWLHLVNVDFWAWLLGTSRNGTTMVGNSTTAMLNGLLGIRDGNTPGTGLDAIGGFFQWWIALIQSATNLVTRVLGMGQRGLRVVNIFTDAINRGLDPDSPSHLSMMSAITASDAVYYLRLGLYVMDNTIFAGPFWYWVGTSQFLVALMVLIWVINSFKNLLKR